MTILEDFLNRVPFANMEKDMDGSNNMVPKVCAQNLGYKVECREHECCYDCWNTPLSGE